MESCTRRLYLTVQGRIKKKTCLLFKLLLYNVAYIAINCQMPMVGQPWRRPELTLPPPLPTSSRPFLRSWLRSLWWRRSNRHWGTLSKWVGQLFRITWMFLRFFWGFHLIQKASTLLRGGNLCCYRAKEASLMVKLLQETTRKSKNATVLSWRGEFFHLCY